ncbi:MAG TPA: hypothetical protein VHI93_07645 [Candidatus Thermoplasmatota archaeon]|nr:hypothetical protein [Candidatus Thermoplasmatota archaeon]
MDGPDPLEALVNPDAWRRLQRARAGAEPPNLLRVGSLAPGDVGVVEATVAQVHPARPFARMRGGRGELCRVTLADASGEADLVLWDDELRHVRDGTLASGARVRLRGAAVKPGYRGGVELGLGSAVLERIDVPAPKLAATLVSLGPTRVLDGPPPRFQADGVVRLVDDGRERHMVLEGETLRQVRAADGTVRLEGLLPHPALDGWLLCTAATRVAQPSDTLK